MDFKGWWHDARGRCEPLTVRDEYGRYILEIRALLNAQTSTVRSAFERLFERYGLPQAIRTDNGTPFASTRALLGLSKLSVWWLAKFSWHPPTVIDRRYNAHRVQKAAGENPNLETRNKSEKLKEETGE